MHIKKNNKLTKFRYVEILNILPQISFNLNIPPINNMPIITSNNMA